MQLRPESTTESTPPRSFAAALREVQNTMSSNSDPIMSVVVAKDVVVIIASNDNDNDMKVAVHSVAK